MRICAVTLRRQLQGIWPMALLAGATLLVQGSPPDPASRVTAAPALQHVRANHVQHFHSERNHQGKGNAILFPVAADRIGESTGEIRTRQRLGGMLKFYYRQAA